MQHFIETSDMNSINNLEPITTINHDHLNENHEKISLKVKEIHNKLNELNRELGEIISQCSHNNYSIKMIAENGSVVKLRKVCDVCQSQIGYLTQEEIKEWTQKI